MAKPPLFDAEFRVTANAGIAALNRFISACSVQGLDSLSSADCLLYRSACSLVQRLEPLLELDIAIDASSCSPADLWEIDEIGALVPSESEPLARFRAALAARL